MDRGDVWTRGLTAGLLGALAVAAWFLIIDLIVGNPLVTAAALGSALFLGASEPAHVEFSVVTIGGYAAAHLIVFVAIGVIASTIVSRAQRRPRVILAAILAVAVVSVLLLGLLAIMAEVLLGDLAWWSVAAGGALAAVAIGVYLWSADPELARAVEKDPFQGDE